MTGQDWFEKDFYATLGVPKNADAADDQEGLPQARPHPAPGPQPGRRRRRGPVQGGRRGVRRAVRPRAAQAVRRDPGDGGRRRAVLRPAPVAAAVRAGFEDLFGGLFGGEGGGAPRAVQRARRGSGRAAAGFEDLLGGLFGGGRRLPAAGPRAAARAGHRGRRRRCRSGRRSRARPSPSSSRAGPSTARIPPGVRDGQRIRLRGKGRPGDAGGPAGDLVITVHVEPHPVFSLDGATCASPCR